MNKFKAISITVCILFIVLLIMFLPIFNIKNVEILGLDNVSEETVMSKIFTKDNVNIHTISKFRLKKELEKIPYIKEVNIIKELPNKLIVDVTERKNIGYITYGEGIYVYIDSEGVVLEMQNYIDEQKPFFSGLNIKEVTKGQKLNVEDDENFNVAVSLANDFSKYDFSDRYVSIRLDDQNNIIFYIDDIKVLFGNTQNIHNKMVWVDAILNNEIDKNASGTLDLRFPDRYPVFSENR